jgi:hypothetical protein
MRFSARCSTGRGNGFKWFQRWNGFWLLASGGLLGLTAYTYLAARLFPIPLALALGVMLFHTPRAALKARLTRCVVVLSVALLVFGPLGLYFLEHPDAFTTRIKQVASSSWSDALRGIRLCLRALAWPNAGDPYVRFNAPGRPVLTPLAAILALIGGVGLLLRPFRDPLSRAGRFLLFALVFVMLLPSALATSEITPSNLRLVGLYPFLAVFPAQGLVILIHAVLRWRLTRSDWRYRWGPRGGWYRGAMLLLLVGGGVATGWTYWQWARSADLFYAADGEMVLAAQALDTLDLADTTPYIASLHYRHPTVAALAQRYAQAKWLTGGATLVLPEKGHALYLWPRTLSSPAPWPDEVLTRWEASSVSPSFSDPNGDVALRVHRLTVEDLAMLRRLFSGRPHLASEPAPSREQGSDFSHVANDFSHVANDFSHVVLTHGARPLLPCAAGRPCPILLSWEARASYPALQPVVRLIHPLTGEWVRTTAFHYPPEQWGIGDLVLDQFSPVLPLSAPPVEGYEIAVGFFNPDNGHVLSRLDEREQFAGLEVRYTLGEVLPQRHAPAVPHCSFEGGYGDEPYAIHTHTVDGVRLLGVDVTLGDFPPGGKLPLALCWQAMGGSNPSAEGLREDETPLPEVDLEIVLDRSRTGDALTEDEASDPTDTILYKGAPVQGLYPFSQWAVGEIIEDRYTLRLPRAQPPGTYILRLRVSNRPLYDFGTLRVISLTREFIDTFVLPNAANAMTVDFGEHIRLLGYALGAVKPGNPLKISLYWQTLMEMEEDYTVFIHWLDAETEQLLSQVDAMPQEDRTLSGSPYPTSLWMRNEVIRDTHYLPIPADLPSGTYRLRVGFYVQQTGKRLRVEGASGVMLSTVDVARK